MKLCGALLTSVQCFSLLCAPACTTQITFQGRLGFSLQFPASPQGLGLSLISQRKESSGVIDVAWNWVHLFVANKWGSVMYLTSWTRTAPGVKSTHSETKAKHSFDWTTETAMFGKCSTFCLINANKVNVYQQWLLSV